MASFNNVQLLGYLGHDPETKSTSGGKTVTTFRLATEERWKDNAGAVQERTEWHNIEVWGAQAKTCAQYINKGRQVMVVGHLRTDLWEKDGQKHSRTKVVASRVLFLGVPDKAEIAGDEPGAEQPV